MWSTRTVFINAYHANTPSRIFLYPCKSIELKVRSQRVYFAPSSGSLPQETRNVPIQCMHATTTPCSPEKSRYSSRGYLEDAYGQWSIQKLQNITPVIPIFYGMANTYAELWYDIFTHTSASRSLYRHHRTSLNETSATPVLLSTLHCKARSTPSPISIRLRGFSADSIQRPWTESYSLTYPYRPSW